MQAAEASGKFTYVPPKEDDTAEGETDETETDTKPTPTPTPAPVAQKVGFSVMLLLAISDESCTTWDELDSLGVLTHPSSYCFILL